MANSIKDELYMSRETKLFIAHLIRYESANNYIAFARELNAHIRKDFAIKLPVAEDGNQIIVL